MKKFLSYSIALSFALFLASSCSDETDNALEPEWGVTVENTESLTFGIHERYYRIVISQYGVCDATLGISSDADWLTLYTDTLPSDGIILLRVAANEEAEGRSADIVLKSSAVPSHNAVVTVRQQGVSEMMTAGGMGTEYKVGAGYNVFREYKSEASICNQVIDIGKLRAYDSTDDYQSFLESARGQDHFEFYHAFSLQEMQSKLTQQTNSTTNYIVARQTVNRYKEVHINEKTSDFFGYARITRTVGTQSIDEGVLNHLVNDSTISIDNLPFTNDFLSIYKEICTTAGDTRDKCIKSLIENFGTHLITEASLGGMIDYVLSFSQEENSNFTKTVEEQSMYVFGKLTRDGMTQTKSKLSSKMNHKETFHITGGSKQKTEALQTAISHLAETDQLPPESLEDWLRDIKSDALNSDETRQDLGIVDFRLLPIWSLFPQTEIRNAIQTKFLSMQKDSDIGYTDKELGTDNYMITNLDQYSTFGTGSDVTLVKVAYNGGTPLMEVCNEYVPKIRGDKRITIFYPIVNGRSRIGLGVFPGDGEGNPPAMLTFSDGDVYVNPIEGYGFFDKLDALYYLNGNLYTQNFGIPVTVISSLTQKEQFVEFNNRYAVVKIGGGYWTRKNVKEDDKNLFKATRTENSILYVRISNGSPTLTILQKQQFGDEEDKLTGERVKWYIPKEEHVLNLYEYIGKNSKSLFKGQISGFDADFAGSYAKYDDINNESYNAYQMAYVGEYCFIPNKDTNNNICLILSKNYKLGYSKQADSNYYPVRLYRTSYYDYSNKK